MTEADPPANGVADLPTRYFYLAGEYRRSAMYAVAGFLLVAAIVVFFPALGPKRSPTGRLAVTFVFVAFAVFLSQLLFQRIRVDNAGVWRRILWWWDLWSWEAFARGEVRQGYFRTCFEMPSRPWWRRRLTVGYLEESDGKALLKLIKTVWTPPAPEPVPVVVELKMAWPNRRLVQMDKGGITITDKRGSSSHRWQEVISAEIWREEADRPDFREFRLQLADQKLELRRSQSHGQDVTTWTGASSEVIAAVCRNVEASVLNDFATHGPAKSLAELDAREARESEKEKSASNINYWCIRLMWLVTASPLLILPWPNSLMMTGMLSLLCFAMHWMSREYAKDIEQRQQAREIEREKWMDSQHQ